MNGPEDGFPYSSIILESDFLECEETDLIDYENVKETDLTVFDFIDEASMNKLNKENGKPCMPGIMEIRETDLSGIIEIPNEHTQMIREIKETDIIEIKETDLSVADEKDKERLRVNSVSVSSEHSSYHHEDDGDTENFSVSTDSGFINEKLNLDLDFNHLTSAIKFQDLESDFFDTDCDTIDKSSTEETNQRGESTDTVRFQDIESDFFETDCEGHESNALTESLVNFQDIESDFFEDEDDISPNTTLKKRKPIQVGITAKRKPTDVIEQKEILTRLSQNKDKRALMTNSLLRSTIEELGKALSNSNLLLAKRDQKINDLRKRNNELKKSLTEELENSAQMKLLLLEKEAVISEKVAAVANLQSSIEKLNEEISDLRIYNLNNFKDFSLTCDPSNLDNSVETALLGDQDISNLQSPVAAGYTQMKSPDSDVTPCKTKCSYTSQKEKPRVSRNTPTKDSPILSPIRSGATSRSSGSPTPGKSPDPDNVSSSELHARLQMKFMRDAFFYYMIGFHSDEQINAILAILNYGDKRQDFVLEAHKLKKMGKKFNVSKVSTRGLTFVQDVQNE